jgi:CubicO group peptidase (beta-lactamase class C family)
MGFLIDGDETVLASQSRREMQTMQVVAAVEDRFLLGYVYGLFVGHDEKLGRVVEHPGGLPGYGSSMRWLPGRRLGVVALANLTYAPMSRATRAALDLIVPPEGREAVVGLTRRLAAQLASWNPDMESELFAENVLLDRTRDERVEEAAAVGAFTTGDVDAVTPTFATMLLHTPTGEARLRVWLTPEVPPRIQRYEVEQ